ncbi:MAG: HNH endonuclease signature motif containing protein [Methylobacter sp.]
MKRRLNTECVITVSSLLAFVLLLAAMMMPEQGNAAVVRSAAAKSQFKKLHPCPATGRRRGACPGFVIDHIIPLACQGPDHPINMQWQTLKDGKVKDKWERRDCTIWYEEPSDRFL